MTYELWLVDFRCMVLIYFLIYLAKIIDRWLLMLLLKWYCMCSTRKARGHCILILRSELCWLLKKDPTVIVKYRMAIKVPLFYLYLCSSVKLDSLKCSCTCTSISILTNYESNTSSVPLSVMLDSISCSFTSISFLTN